MVQGSTTSGTIQRRCDRQLNSQRPFTDTLLTVIEMNTHRLLATIAILLFTSVTPAQTNTGQIKGALRDHTGAVIPGANVTVTNVASGLTVARVTDSSGDFVFPSLAVGEWTMSVSAYGFKQLKKSDSICNSGRSSIWSCSLKSATSP